VSSPSDPQPPVETAGGVSTSTQEIPFVQSGPPQQLPPHPGAVAPAEVAMEEPQPTGPVDFVPGLPGTPPVPPPATPSPQPPAAASPQPPAAEAPATTPGPVWPETLETDGTADRAGTESSIRRPRDRSAAVGAGLTVLALALLELGLSLGFGAESYWSAVPLWSGFATLCAVLGLVAFVASGTSAGRLRSGMVWKIAAGGLVGLAVFWLLVVLPVVAGDRGFLLTAALGALGAALWVGAGRKA
jgi:hypothetical protein